MKNFSLSNKNELIIFSSLLFFSFLLWNSFLIYPIKLFSVVIHEVFHGFVTLLTGGKILSINIGFNLGGNVESQFGNDFLISLAGYFGSLFIGFVFFNFSSNKIFLKYFFYGLIFIIIVVLANSNSNTDFIIVSFIVILFLFLLSMYNENFYVQLLLKFFGLISMIYVFIDLKNDLFDEFYKSDAKIFSELLNMNYYLISFIWILISFAIIFFSIRKNYFSK